MTQQLPSKSEPEISQETITVSGAERQITRNSLGKFVKGVSGNPAGRPKGSKSRTLQIKQAMEEALARDSAESFQEIVNQAIEMAKGGDKDMIRFILGDVLKEVRRADPEDAESTKIGSINITFNPYTGPDNNAVQNVLEGEYAEIEANDPNIPPS